MGRNADAFARDLAPVLAEIRAGGATTLHGIAAAFNERGVLTRRGGAWGVSNVRNLIARIDASEKKCGYSSKRQAAS